MPSEIIDLCTLSLGFSSDFGWSISTKRSVNPNMIVIVAKLTEFSLQINRIPKENMIEIFSIYGSN